ncbi:MAG: UDP-forming cellulose synthase catalytic subunit [Myxococcota bacterium]
MFRSWIQVGALALAMAAITVYAVAVLPLQVHVMLSLVLVAAALALHQLGPKYRLILVGMSLAVALRYLWWRAFESLNWYGSTLDIITSLSLFGAEIYAVVILVTGQFQTAILKRRKSIPLSEYEGELPTVDVFIPTYNEDVDIVRRTALGALGMTYPHKKIYLLDDGRRPAMAALAKEVGCGYLTRDDNKGAKAGNINRALAKTDGDLVAIFDADHVPVRSFLDLTVGFFLANEKMSLVQTPHHFFNPDPFERNLYVRGSVPPEGDFFYRRIHLGLDFWNASFFCGSCAVLRRTALDQVGGIAVETVTEDAHTALKMHALGWESAYLSIPQAAGLAVERYASYVGQRIRWARGMGQILRVDPPPLKKGLSFGQRVNYFAASFHFFFGVPRMVFILAPLAYLVFGLHPLACNVWDVMLYVAPHLILSWLTGLNNHGSTRHSFWPEVYEVSIAPYVALVTTIALISPQQGTFNVTDKGSMIERAVYDFKPARPIIVLLLLLVVGFIFVPLRMMWSPDEAATIMVGGIWNLYNFIIVGAAVMVAFERPQRRGNHRVPWTHPTKLTMVNIPGQAAPTFVQRQARGIDLSEGGIQLSVSGTEPVTDLFEVALDSNFGLRTVLKARTLSQRKVGDGLRVNATFDELPQDVMHDVIRHMFSAADTWIERPAPKDRWGRSLGAVIIAPWRTLFYSLTGRTPDESPQYEPGASPERRLHTCTACSGVTELPADVCHACSHGISQPALVPPEPRRLIPVMARTVSIAALPLLFLGSSVAAGLAWNQTLGPLIEASDAIPRHFDAQANTSLAPVIEETRRLELELRRSLMANAEVKPSWSKRLWAVHSRFDDLRDSDVDNLPPPKVLQELATTLEGLRVLHSQSREADVPADFLPRLNAIRDALDAVASVPTLSSATNAG